MKSRSAARFVVAAALLGTSWAQTTQRVSVSTSGAESHGLCDFIAISADGRFVAFRSFASDLVPADTNAADIFVRDRLLGTTELVDVDTGGTQANGLCVFVSISGDGRFVAFDSSATNLVPGDTNAMQDVFVRDRVLGTTERVSVSSTGTPGDLNSGQPSISSDGRYVAFHSLAWNLAPGETSGFEDVFVRDRQLGTTVRVSDASGGAGGDGTSYGASISSDGRFVAFTSQATNLVPGDTNSTPDVFVRDLLLGALERVSVDSGGLQVSGRSFDARISADGRWVIFYSEADGLVAGDTNGIGDVFVRDRQLGMTERVSVDSSGTEGNLFSFPGGISADGRYAMFSSDATNLVAGDGNLSRDVFLRDRQLGTTAWVSVASSGQGGNGFSDRGAISPDGLQVAFWSAATDLVPADSNGSFDVFVHDREGGPDFASTCDAGIGGVLACPCGNPPSGPGRGCDNSAGTGGAVLTASGSTSLSSDSLVFATSAERATALSIVSQWSAPAASGAVFGMGVRCATGTLKRMYTKSAVGGGITAPSFGAGDPQVSVRSSTLGDAISAGQSRWYFVYYRDPNVLGGCPASSTFNATQTGVVAWSP